MNACADAADTAERLIAIATVTAVSVSTALCRMCVCVCVCGSSRLPRMFCIRTFEIAMLVCMEHMFLMMIGVMSMLMVMFVGIRDYYENMVIRDNHPDLRVSLS